MHLYVISDSKMQYWREMQMPCTFVHSEFHVFRRRSNKDGTRQHLLKDWARARGGERSEQGKWDVIDRLLLLFR